MKNDNLNVHAPYRAYGIHILDSNIPNRPEINNNIYN